MSRSIVIITSGIYLVGIVLICYGCSGILSPLQNPQIYIINVDGAGEIQLSKGLSNCYKPTFFPNGKKIAFEAGSSPSRSIFVVNTDGTGLRKLTQGTNDNSNPQISPDGSKIAFVSWSRGIGNRIFVMDSKGKNPEQLMREEDLECSSPEFSSDGKWLVFRCAQPGGNYGIRAVDLSSKESKWLTNENSQHLSPVFSSDGENVLYIVRQQPDKYQINQLHTVYLNGENARVIVESFNAVHAEYSLSSDGKAIVFARLEGLFVVNTDGTELKQITSNVGDPSYPTDLYPSFSPDSEKIIFASGMPGKRDLYTIKRDGTDRKRLTSKPGWYYSSEFSPDRKEIVFSASK